MSTPTDGPKNEVALSSPERLNHTHDLSNFDCGEVSINEYLHDKARQAQEKKHAIVYVSCFSGTNKVAAYYTLSGGSVDRSHVVPKKHQRNSPSNHPVTILGRMGITLEAQGQGYATDLLQDAITRCISASEVVASSAVIVHPLNEDLAGFYERKAGFKPCPDLSPLTMMLPLL
ncbi:GNAT family N-acetyltransferase [Pseudomonas anguilliseptica]|uniref:GNAT family N-acetyltransferase n=1 Tax=Pseudomonas anguilliseptica TaxID=53406 RepID=UPI0022AFDE4E|nr:GNAT family N-acetyltransferase [Pseudomonas anguilliseptica]MCZ4324393.1 GNAT family N-acetyltransferase [Pseudomonas anguilliseptica]